MKKANTIIAGVIAGVALVVTAASYAQPFNGMGPGHGPMAGMDPSVRVESRLSDLKTQLKITATQEAAWQAYAGQAKQQAAGMQALRAQMNQGTATAPERMAQRTAAMQQRSSAMAAIDGAFNTLYAILTPEQKSIADQSFRMMGQRGMHFGGRAG